MEFEGDLDAAEAAYRRVVEIDDSVANRILYALFLQGQGRMDDALEQLKGAVAAAEDPDQRTNARVIVASFHMNRGDLEEAERELLAAREEDPDNEALLTSIARFYAAQGDPTRAEEMLELRAQQSPENPQPLLALGEFHRRSGDMEAALAAFDRAIQVDPRNEAARLRKAELLMEKGKSDPELQKQARALLNQVLEENPSSVRRLFTQGKFLLIAGSYEEAAAKLRRVIDEEPQSNAHLLLGVAYAKLGQSELARSEFLRAVQLDADNYLARVQLAAVYQTMGEYELAAEEASAAVKGRSRRDIRGLLVLAESSAALNRTQDALQALDDIRFERADGGDETTARIHAARLYRRLGQIEKSQRILAEGLEKRPNELRLVGEQVLGDLDARDPQEALERLNRAIEKHPDAALLYAMRGRVYMGFTRKNELVFPDEAEADLKKAIELEPENADPYASLAQLYRQTGRLQEAVDAFVKAAEADPTNANARVVLGTLYEQAGQFDKAIEEYEAAIRLDSRQAIARNNLAWLLAQSSEDEASLDRALQLAQVARELMPTNPSVADTLGWVMLKREAPTAAISLFREAIEGYRPGAPERGVVRYHLAKAYEQNGDREKAVEELERALAEVPSFPDRSKAEELLAQLKAG
jgi:tetratricopeptide (TPR) repeat protein